MKKWRCGYGWYDIIKEEDMSKGFKYELVIYELIYMFIIYIE
jgi:hypothetical protein